MNDGSIQGPEMRKEQSHDGDARDQLAGICDVGDFIPLAEPIWLFLGFDAPEFDSTKILWAIPVVGYVIVAAVLLIRGNPADRDQS